MRYSLAQLLLEDLRARVVTGVELPSEEEAARTYLVNTYRWLKGGAGTLTQVFKDKALFLAYKLSPSVKEIVDEARDLAKQREQDVSLLVRDTSFDDYVWQIFDPASTSSNDDLRKAAAWCFRYYDETLFPPKLKIARSSTQSAAEFEAEVRLGARQIRLAAASAALSELDRRVDVLQENLQGVVAEEALLTRIRQGLSGDDAANPTFDLKQDRVIAPILRAARKTEREFRKMTTVRGQMTVFDFDSSGNTINVSGGSIDRASLLTNCGAIPSSVIPEARVLRGRIVRRLNELTAGGDPPDPADAPAIPATIQEAQDQLLSRYPSIVIAYRYLKKYLDRSLNTQAIIGAVKLAPSVRKLLFRFPSERGDLGSAVQLTTQGSVPPHRVAAGLVLLFMHNARNEDVQQEVVDLLAHELRVPPTGERINTVNLTSFLSKDENITPSVIDAIIYIFCALAEFGSKGAASRGVRLRGSTSFSSFSQDSLDRLLTFYRVKALAGPKHFPEVEEGVILVPGMEREPWIDRMMGLVKTLVAEPEEKSPEEKSGQRVIRSLAPPNITFDTSDPESRIFMQPPDSPEARNRVQSAEYAKKTIDLLLKEANAAAVTLRRIATDSLKSDDVLPDRSTARIGPYLGMIEFCRDIAQFSRESHMRGFLQKMGYSSSESLLMRDGVQGIDVWARLCNLTGATESPAVGHNPEFKHSAAESWKSAMTGDNKLQAMQGVKMLLMADFISPILRCARHAVDGYGPGQGGVSRRGLLTDEEVNKLIYRINAARSSIVRSIKYGAQPSAAPQRGIAFRTGRATLKRDAVKLSGVRLNFGNFGDMGFNLSDLLAPIIQADTGDIVDTEVVADPDAPRVVDPQEYARQAEPSVVPAPPPPPPPVDPAPAAPSSDPPPVNDPQTSPAPGGDEEFDKAYSRAIEKIKAGGRYAQTEIGAEDFPTMKRVTDALLRRGVLMPELKLTCEVLVPDDGEQSVKVRVTIKIERDWKSAGPDVNVGSFDLYGNQGAAISDDPGKIALTTKRGRDVTVQDLVDEMMRGLAGDLTSVMPDTVNVNISRDAAGSSTISAEHAEDPDEE